MLPALLAPESPVMRWAAVNGTTRATAMAARMEDFMVVEWDGCCCRWACCIDKESGWSDGSQSVQNQQSQSK